MPDMRDMIRDAFEGIGLSDFAADALCVDLMVFYLADSSQGAYFEDTGPDMWADLQRTLGEIPEGPIAGRLLQSLIYRQSVIEDLDLFDGFAFWAPEYTSLAADIARLAGEGARESQVDHFVWIATFVMATAIHHGHAALPQLAPSTARYIWRIACMLDRASGDIRPYDKPLPPVRRRDHPLIYDMVSLLHVRVAQGRK